MNQGGGPERNSPFVMPAVKIGERIQSSSVPHVVAGAECGGADALSGALRDFVTRPMRYCSASD